MAIKLGIIGEPNSGKSFSRTYLTKGEEVFIIAPSAKSTHTKDSSGNPLQRLNIYNDKFPTIESLAVAGKTTIHGVVAKIDTIPGYKISGNYVRCRLDSIQMYLKFVDKYMPHIKTIIIADFSHYISAVLSNRAFIQRKAGGEAFQRFWELAGDALENVILSIDELRDDLIVVTEYHSEYDEASDNWRIFVPGGKMLIQAFKLDSYYDYMLYTHVKLKESGEVESYNFVTRRFGKYNARCAELFKDTFIPNNLQIVLDKMREANGI